MSTINYNLFISLFILGKRTVCTLCGKAVKVLKAHMAFMHGTDFCPCPLCKLTFKHPDALKVHLRRHRTQDRKQKIADTTCKICGEKCKDMRRLSRHTNEVHKGESAKIHVCSFCGKSFFGRPQKVRMNNITKEVD